MRGARAVMAWRRIAFVFLLVGFITAPRVPAAAEHVEIFITAPYLDVRSGPGRGYPVFYAFERGDSVHVLRQRTDWILVRGRGVEGWAATEDRSEEHTSELQSRGQLVCRLLLEKKKNRTKQ